MPDQAQAADRPEADFVADDLQAVAEDRSGDDESAEDVELIDGEIDGDPEPDPTVTLQRHPRRCAAPYERKLVAIRRKIMDLGRRTMEAAFEIGELLEEAFGLLPRGHFTAWVRHQCGIDPRTAFAYRELWKLVAEDEVLKKRLLSCNLSPTTAILLATTPRDFIESMIGHGCESGIRITSAYVRAQLRIHRMATGTPPPYANNPKKVAVAEVRRILDEVAEKALIRIQGALSQADVTSEMAVEIATTNLVEALQAALTPASLADARKGLLNAVGSHASSGSLPAKPRDLQGTLEAAPPTVVEFCAGAGGMALGLHKAGFRHLKLVEIDENACETLRRNITNNRGPMTGNGAVVEYLDVRKFDGAPLKGTVDLLAAGPPCQPFTSAGKRLGPDDERNLFPEAKRLVEEIQPKAFLFENVIGMRRIFPGYSSEVVRDFERLGYKVLLSEMNGLQFALPQTRKRIMYIGLKPEFADFFRWPSLGDSPIHLDMSFFLADSVRKSGYTDAENIIELLQNHTFSATYDDYLSGNCPDGYEVDETALGPTMLASGGPTSRDFVFPRPRPIRDGDAEAPENKGIWRRHFRLTMEMMAALQGFPPDYEFVGEKGSQRRQIGNSVPPVFAQWVGLAIRAALEKRVIDSPADIIRRRPPAYVSAQPGIGDNGRPLPPKPIQPNPDFAPFRVPGSVAPLLHPSEIERMGLRMAVGD